jgi:hypothetical protein
VLRTLDGQPVTALYGISEQAPKGKTLKTPSIHSQKPHGLAERYPKAGEAMPVGIVLPSAPTTLLP